MVTPYNGHTGRYTAAFGCDTGKFSIATIIKTLVFSVPNLGVPDGPLLPTSSVKPTNPK